MTSQRRQNYPDVDFRNQYRRHTVERTTRKHRSADWNVAEWAANVDAYDLYASAITMQELEIGILQIERRNAAQGAFFAPGLGAIYSS